MVGPVPGIKIVHFCSNVKLWVRQQSVRGGHPRQLLLLDLLPRQQGPPRVQGLRLHLLLNLHRGLAQAKPHLSQPMQTRPLQAQGRHS
jgi:hypothetical protein